MSRSATPATRNEAMRRWKAPKGTPVAELTIGTAIRASRRRLRTAANGCATSREHSSTSTPPEWNGNPCYAFGKKNEKNTNLEGIAPKMEISSLPGKIQLLVMSLALKPMVTWGSPLCSWLLACRSRTCRVRLALVTSNHSSHGIFSSHGGGYSETTLL